MRIGTFNIGGLTQLGVISDEGVQYLNHSEGWPATMIEWIAASEQMEERYSTLKDDIENPSWKIHVPIELANSVAESLLFWSKIK